MENDLVEIKRNKAMTTSFIKVLQKKYKSILAWFISKPYYYYISLQNKKEPMPFITYFIMKSTKAKTKKLKLKYIKIFNIMKSMLNV